MSSESVSEVSEPQKRWLAYLEARGKERPKKPLSEIDEYFTKWFDDRKARHFADRPIWTDKAKEDYLYTAYLEDLFTDPRMTGVWSRSIAKVINVLGKDRKKKQIEERKTAMMLKTGSQEENPIDPEKLKAQEELGQIDDKTEAFELIKDFFDHAARCRVWLGFGHKLSLGEQKKICTKMSTAITRMLDIWNAADQRFINRVINLGLNYWLAKRRAQARQRHSTQDNPTQQGADNHPRFRPTPAMLDDMLRYLASFFKDYPAMIPFNKRNPRNLPLIPGWSSDMHDFFLGSKVNAENSDAHYLIRQLRLYINTCFPAPTSFNDLIADTVNTLVDLDANITADHVRSIINGDQRGKRRERKNAMRERSTKRRPN